MPRLMKDKQSERKLFLNRTVVATFIIIVLVVLLIARLFYLQVVKHNYYSTLSQKNSTNFIPIPPRRGLIYDRNGVLLAENIPVYSLMLTPSKIKNMNQTINQLEKIIQITPDEITEFRKTLKQHRLFDTIPLKIKLTNDEVAKLSVNRYEFPGVSVKAELIRHYTLGKALTPVLGYVGRINKKELASVNQENYAGTNFIGKTGIENYYENILHGKVGTQHMEVDADGRQVRPLTTTPAVPGQNIYLSIDSQLQLAAYKALGKNNGVVIAIQPSTGQVLALVSKPSFDANLFVDGIREAVYKTLVNNKNQPLYNRAIHGLYPAGSTVKPMLSLQALQQNIITPDFTIHDPGYYKLPHSSHIYHDWKVGGHGIVNVSKAIIESCDTFFYSLGHKMGIQNIDDILGAFGYGQKTGIDLPDELPGTLPSPAWKLAHRQTHWYPGDTVITAIGQGYTQITPLQLANAISAISERGKRFKPYLLYATANAAGQKTLEQPTPLPPVKIDDANWKVVINAMETIIEVDGNAWRFGIPKNFTAAGKPGTAQAVSIRYGENYTNVPKKLRPNSLFMVFAPVNNPQIAVVAVAEHDPGHSAPITRKVLDYYFAHRQQILGQVSKTTPAPHSVIPVKTGIQQNASHDHNISPGSRPAPG